MQILVNDHHQLVAAIAPTHMPAIPTTTTQVVGAIKTDISTVTTTAGEGPSGSAGPSAIGTLALRPPTPPTGVTFSGVESSAKQVG